jgi:hypothetical protein
MNLCAYKDVFGAPKTGVHRYRLFGVAVVDVLATVLLAWLVAKTTGHRMLVVLPLMFLLGIVAHRLFCVRTTVDMWLF